MKISRLFFLVLVLASAARSETLPDGFLVTVENFKGSSTEATGVVYRKGTDFFLAFRPEEHLDWGQEVSGGLSSWRLNIHQKRFLHWLSNSEDRVLTSGKYREGGQVVYLVAKFSPGATGNIVELYAGISSRKAIEVPPARSHNGQKADEVALREIPVNGRRKGSDSVKFEVECVEVIASGGEPGVRTTPRINFARYR